MKTLKAILILVVLIFVSGFVKLAAQQSTDPGASISKSYEQPRVVHNWNGNSSSAWNFAGNWSPASIPTSNDDVVIGGSGTIIHMPEVIMPNAQCRNLTLTSFSMMLTINMTGTLHVYGKIDNYGIISLHNDMTVESNLILHMDSLLNSPDPGTILTVNGSCYLDTDSELVMNMGTFIMSGSGSGSFTNLGEVCSFFDVLLNKTGNITFSPTSVTPVSINGNLTVASGTSCTSNMYQDLTLYGNLVVNPGGHFYGLQGGVCCNGGTIPQSLNFNNTDSYIRNLTIAGNVSLASNISIYGNLLLSSGTFSPGIHSVYLKGDWMNQVGPSAFAKGSSRVVFYGTTDQIISLPLTSTTPEEEFHIVEVNKASGNLLLATTGQTVSCDSYDWTAGSIKVMAGTLNIESLYDICLSGSFYLYATGTINVTSGGSVGFNCQLYIYGGAFHVHGGSADSQWPNSSACGITMSDGVLEFHDVGVVVDNTAIAFTENITGGTIRVNGGFYIGRPDFHPSGGTIEFAGSNPASIGMVDGACFHNVLINKTSSPSPDMSSEALSAISGSRFSQSGQIRNNVLTTSTSLAVHGWVDLREESSFDVYHDMVVDTYVDLYGEWLANQGVTTVTDYETHETHVLMVMTSADFIVTGSNPTDPVLEENGTIVIEEDANFAAEAKIATVNSTGHIMFTGGGGGGSGARYKCSGFTALHSGSFIPSTGTLELTGNSDAPRFLNLASGNHCCNLLINSQGPIVLQNDCDVYGDLHIQQGTLDVSPSNYAINLHGSWIDDMAPSGFEARNGTVRFLGGGAGSGADIYTGGGDESFFDMIINKPGGTVTSHCGVHLAGDLDIWPDSFFDVFFDISLAGDLDLEGGLELENNVHASVSGLPTLAVASVLIVNWSADIVTNDTLQNLPPIFAQGVIIIRDGEFTANQALVVSSTGSVQFANGGGGGGAGRLSCHGIEALTSGSFAPEMGTLEITGSLSSALVHINLGIGNKAFNLLVNTPSTALLGNDLTVSGDLFIVLGDLDVSTNNYSIMLWGSWTNSSPSQGFLARDGSVHFVGSGETHISTNKEEELFHNLNVNRDGTLVLDDHVCTTGDGYCDIILGTLYVNDHDLTIGGNCSIGNGGMLFLDGGTCAMADGRVLTVNSGGTCKAHGNRNRDSKMKGKQEAESRWKLKVNNGGHISAKQTEFKHLREEGVKVYPGGNIDPDGDFDECKFNSGASGCSFLTLDNSQDLSIDAIEFVASSGELHNIAKLENAGHILVASSSGNFAGPLHENDPFGRVDWVGYDPNLVVTEFTASDYHPFVGTPVNLHVEVTNQSPTTIEVDCIWIRIFESVTGELIHEECVPVDDGLIGFGVVELDVSHTRYAPLTELLAVWADPMNSIPESNETDNQAELPQPLVWSGLPDLVVVSFIPSNPDPYVADLVTYSVTILNDSDTPILQPFNVHFFKNRPTQPGWDEFGDLEHSCGPMLPHASYSFDFTNLYSMVPELWNSHLMIDPEGVIHESEEFNNHQQALIQYHPLDQPQTFITPIRTTDRYIQARIHWNYPLWVSRFKIYASDDPEGDFILLDWTIDSFFDVYLDAPRLFYKVTAERDDPFPTK